MKNKIAKLLIGFSVLAVLLLSSSGVEARDVSQITDWYIKDFQSDIVVNKDSSLDITEKIVADCGDLTDKHGIFRILPTYYQKTASEKVYTPITLKSITDFDGNQISYSSSRSSGSLTWKIGDASKTVHGENNYKIIYHVENAMRFGNKKFDEFYWNLNGNFWQIETDHFLATVHFPVEPLSKTIDLYSGSFGEKDQGLASYSWIDNKTLTVESKQTLLAGEGITVSATFAKDFFVPYAPTFFEKYGQLLWLLLPLLTYYFCLRLWRKYGRDPKLHKAEMVQYQPPEDIGPVESAMLLTNSSFSNNFISAGIINLAVKGVIKIKEIPKKGIFGQKDFEITFLKDNLEETKTLSATEVTLATELKKHARGNVLKINSIKNKFYTSIPQIVQSGKDFLFQKKYLSEKSFRKRTIMIVLWVFSIIATIGVSIFLVTQYFMTVNFAMAIIALILNDIVLLIFVFLMPSQTVAGAEKIWEIKGFKLFMTKAEKYRAPFHEKEGLFEKYLPYAMIFGVTKMWVENMKKIYGENYFNTYHPIWYYGYVGNFDADTFSSSITDLSNSMASTLASSPSSSGSGGGGFSGGGGGGGGGGGW